MVHVGCDRVQRDRNAALRNARLHFPAPDEAVWGVPGGAVWGWEDDSFRNELDLGAGRRAGRNRTPAASGNRAAYRRRNRINSDRMFQKSTRTPMVMM